MIWRARRLPVARAAFIGKCTPAKRGTSRRREVGRATGAAESSRDLDRVELFSHVLASEPLFLAPKRVPVGAVSRERTAELSKRRSASSAPAPGLAADHVFACVRDAPVAAAAAVAVELVVHSLHLGARKHVSYLTSRPSDGKHELDKTRAKRCESPAAAGTTSRDRCPSCAPPNSGLVKSSPAILRVKKRDALRSLPARTKGTKRKASPCDSIRFRGQDKRAPSSFQLRTRTASIQPWIDSSTSNGAALRRRSRRSSPLGAC